MLHAMIMAGGGGTRFWPRSRTNRPKQFLTFSGDRTLLQGTLDRIVARVAPERIWVITGAAYVEEAARQLPELPRQKVVGEPFGRDTAACIGLGAALIARTDPDATMIVMPADHVIEPTSDFHRAVSAAEHFARQYPEALLTFGIPPTFPSTGYGYIHRGESIATCDEVRLYAAKEFKEKPNADTAERFIQSGEFYWNSGIFVWKTAAILNELKRLKPGIHAAIERIADAWNTPRRDEVFLHEYQNIEKKSIDFAVMQEAKKVLVMQAPYEWDDVGSWLALERRNKPDEHGNTVQGTHCGIKTQNCVVVSDGDHLVATIGVKDLIIIQDGNATLVASREEEATVKEIVEQLKLRKRSEYL